MRKFILPISLVFILLASGCTSLDPTSLVKATPAVSKFLEQYPNAEVKAVHYTVEESSSIIDDIMADCEKEAVTPKEYYKVTITDAASDLDVVAWVDVKNQLVECVVKRGSNETAPIAYHECTAEQKNATICTMDYSPVCAQVDTGIRCIKAPCPSTEWKTFSNACVACSTEGVFGWKQGACGTVCQSKYKAKCDSGHVYWFDSCGNIEGKKEYCPLGCENDACVKDSNVCEVEKNYMEKPACNCPAGYNMIVVYPRCESTASQTASTEEAPVASTTSGGGSGNSDGISGQITGMPIAQAVQTQEGKVQIAEEYTTEATERCSGGQPFYRCVKNTECKPHAKAACYGNHVYWFDSCGNAQEKKEYCENGCSNGACVTNGYRNAYWECYDGNEYSEGGETSCKSSDTWRQYAEKSCEGRCTNTAATTAIKPKCGVSSFSVKNECDGLNECSGICPMYATVPPGWCAGGTIVSGGNDVCGCQLPPKCVESGDVCCELYGYGAQMVECCQTYAWTTERSCAVPEGLVGGGMRVVDDSYCSAVDLKVNGVDKPAAVEYGSKVTVSWTTRGNVSSCNTFGHWIPLYDMSGVMGHVPIGTSGTMYLKAAFAESGNLSRIGYMNTLSIGVQCFEAVPSTYTGDIPSVTDQIDLSVYQSQTCIDSDGGFDIWERGNVRGVGNPDYCAYITESWTVQGTDSCEGSHPDCFLVEQSCDEPSASLVVTTFPISNPEITGYGSYVNCPHGCENGACVKSTAVCTSHSYSACYGDHVYWFDSCGSAQEKKEYCANGCTNGVCKPETPADCTDSDGGINQFAKSTVNAFSTTGSPVSGTDYCTTIEGKSHVQEYFCGAETPRMSVTPIECAFGCENGACLPLSQATVTDFINDDYGGYFVNYTVNNGVYRNTLMETTDYDCNFPSSGGCNLSLMTFEFYNESDAETLYAGFVETNAIPNGCQKLSISGEEVYKCESGGKYKYYWQAGQFYFAPMSCKYAYDSVCRAYIAWIVYVYTPGTEL